MITETHAPNGSTALSQVPNGLIARMKWEGLWLVFTRIEDAIGHWSSDHKGKGVAE